MEAADAPDEYADTALIEPPAVEPAEDAAEADVAGCVLLLLPPEDPREELGRTLADAVLPGAEAAFERDPEAWARRKKNAHHVSIEI